MGAEGLMNWFGINKLRWIAGLVLLTLGLVSTGLPAQVPGLPENSLYKTPSEMFQPGEMDPILQGMGNPDPDCETIGGEADRLLDLYYSQFVEEKKTAYDRRTAPPLTDGFDANRMRLLSMERSRMVGPVAFQGDSPYLFSLHFMKGRCAELAGDRSRAALHYIEAFRYTALVLPWKSAEDDTNGGISRDTLETMGGSFSNPGRISEESDPAIRTAALRFQDLGPEYRRNTEELAMARDNVAAAQAALARGKTADPVAARAEVARLEQENLQLINELIAMRDGPFQSYMTRKGRITGELAFRLARVFHDIELERGEEDLFRRRLSDFQASGAGIRIPDPSSRTDAYIAFLELSWKLNPENPETISLLAREYGKARKTAKAIQFTELYIQMVRNENPDPAMMESSYRNLGHLYMDQGNQIKAADALESSMALLDGNPQIATKDDRLEATERLAFLHFQKTGRFERSRELFLRVLQDLEGRDPARLPAQEAFQLHAKRMEVHTCLASISRRFRNESGELDELEKASREYGEMEKGYLALQEEMENLKIRINSIKSGLLSREDEEVQREYYTLIRLEQPALERSAREYRIRLESMNHPALLERRAFLLARRRQFYESMDLYRQVVQSGNSAEKTRSRRNLTLLEKSSRTGQVPPLQVPEGFERY